MYVVAQNVGKCGTKFNVLIKLLENVSVKYIPLQNNDVNADYKKLLLIRELELI